MFKRKNNNTGIIDKNNTGIIDAENIKIEDIEIEVQRKKIKNLNLAVLSPNGRVRVSAPLKMSEVVILDFVRAKIPWIRKHQEQIRKRAEKSDATEMKYVSGECVFVWGEKYTLEIEQVIATERIEVIGDVLHLSIRAGSTPEQRAKILNEWHRDNLKNEIPALIEKWEKIVGVRTNDWGVKNMKTRWGTCNIRDKRIWLNLQLAKKNPQCLEYVVVHELVHLLEKKHDKVFYGYMDQFLPGWKTIRSGLNGAA